MKPILNIENLTKIYGNVPSQTKALNGITFQVMPGEFLGIMGSSGSGKSTLLNCIATVIQPTGGSIQVEGDTLQSLKGKALAEYRGKKVYKLLVISCIDNLLKGASGQAVHNMNLMFNLEETVGLRLKPSAF